MKIFDDDFERYLELEKKWDDAEKADAPEEALDVIREEMGQLELAIASKGKGYRETFKDYVRAFKNDNAYINIDGICFESAEKMIARLRRYGIEKFTWSSSWTSATSEAWKFIECGCEVDGMMLVNDGRDPMTGEYDKKPAYIFKIK